MQTFIKEYDYYILKALADKTKHVYKFFKIGEADNKSRPDTLCKKYTKKDSKLNANTIKLFVGALPHNNKKRLNDKTIHKYLDKTKFKKVDPSLIEGVFNETDGYDEFFECIDQTMTDEDVINEINKTVEMLSQDENNFTTKIKLLQNKLHYEQKHLVGSKLIKYVKQLGNLNLNRDEDKDIAIVGQWMPDYIATFALENNVTILHDDADQKHHYNYEPLNNKINYVNEIKEYLNLMNLKPNAIILANPPYGKVNAEFTRETIDNIDFDKFILIGPTADFIRHDPTILSHINPEEVITVRKAFEDASVTTQVMAVHKEKVNDYTPEEFEVLTYTEPLLKKFFLENIKRKDEAIDNARCLTGNSDLSNINPTNTFILGERTIGSGYISTDPSTLTHQWNVLKTATVADWNLSTNNQYSQIACVSDPVRNKFMTDFVYENLDFIKLIFGAVSKNKVKVLKKVMPKPSTGWTRHYTLVELLKDFNYTTDEIDKLLTKIGRK